MFSYKVNTEKNIDVISHYIGSDVLRNCQLLVSKNEVTVKLFGEKNNFVSTLKYIEY